MGLYEVLDDVLDRHGDVWLESCANGGMIIDLGMLRRSHSTWINDFVAFEVLGQPFDLDIIRSYRGGACSMLPAVCPQSLLGLPTEIRESDEPLSPFHYIRHFAGTITFGQAMCKWKKSDIETARACMDLFKQLRPLMAEDFYLLLPQASAKDVWDAWQFHTASGEGVVIAFRMEDCPQAEQTLQLKGLQPGAKIETEILHGAESVQIDQASMTIRLAEPKTAAVVRYRT